MAAATLMDVRGPASGIAPRPAADAIATASTPPQRQPRGQGMGPGQGQDPGGAEHQQPGHQGPEESCPQPYRKGPEGLEQFRPRRGLDAEREQGLAAQAGHLGRQAGHQQRGPDQVRLEAAAQLLGHEDHPHQGGVERAGQACTGGGGQQFSGQAAPAQPVGHSGPELGGGTFSADRQQGQAGRAPECQSSGCGSGRQLVIPPFRPLEGLEELGQTRPRGTAQGTGL